MVDPRTANAPDEPALSVILCTSGPFSAIEATVRHLDEQTARQQIELLIVAPDTTRVRPLEERLARLHSWRIVEVGPFRTLVEAKVKALPFASAPVIAFAEDHSFPEPGWAHALIEAHREGWTVVAPEIVNANPGGLLSWANLFMHFGGSIEPGTRHEVAVPTSSHNTSYGREALLGIRTELSELMNVELFLNERLRSSGHKCLLEPAARTRHVNMSRFRPNFSHHLIGGRLYGATRAKLGNWSPLRRLIYICGSPLVPPLRLVRVRREIRRTTHANLFPRLLPALIAGLAVYAVGEAIGYLFGVGDADVKYAANELDRQRHVVDRDLAAWS
jgi:hypothetical protein